MVAPALILAEQQALQSRDKRVGAFLGEGAQDEAVGTDDDEAVPAPAEQARVRRTHGYRRKWLRPARTILVAVARTVVRVP